MFVTGRTELPGAHLILGIWKLIQNTECQQSFVALLECIEWIVFTSSILKYVACSDQNQQDCITIVCILKCEMIKNCQSYLRSKVDLTPGSSGEGLFNWVCKITLFLSIGRWQFWTRLTLTCD